MTAQTGPYTGLTWRCVLRHNTSDSLQALADFINICGDDLAIAFEEVPLKFPLADIYKATGFLGIFTRAAQNNNKVLDIFKDMVACAMGADHQPDEETLGEYTETLHPTILAAIALDIFDNGRSGSDLSRKEFIKACQNGALRMTGAR